MRPSFVAWRAGGYANAAVPRAADPASLQTLAGRTMGTTWSLAFDNPSMHDRESIRSAVVGALDRVIDQMSTWERDSDISRYNRAAAGTRHTLPPAFAEVLGCALQWAEASGGAIDPTIGPLVALWGFGADATPSDPSDSGAAPRMPPDAASLAAARARVGWQRVGFDPVERTVEQPGSMVLDLSGVAKGFAVDHVTDALSAIGLRDFLMEVGGELRGTGRRPGGQPWRVKIDAVDAVDSVDAASPLPLNDLAVATSGDRWHAHSHAGRRWSHTIDPRSGEPAADTLASVTVLHPRCMHADALATALTVLGAGEGPAFAERLGIAALFVCRDGDAAPRVLASPAWRECVKS